MWIRIPPDYRQRERHSPEIRAVVGHHCSFGHLRQQQFAFNVSKTGRKHVDCFNPKTRAAFLVSGVRLSVIACRN